MSSSSSASVAASAAIMRSSACGLRPHQLVKFALNDELLAALSVLDREHHHNCHGGGCRVQRDLPPRREAGHDSDDEPAAQQARDGDSCGCLRGPVTELVEKVATAGVVRPAQRPGVIGAAMDSTARRRGNCSTDVRRLGRRGRRRHVSFYPRHRAPMPGRMLVHADRCAGEGGDHRDEVLSVGAWRRRGQDPSVPVSGRPMSRVTMGADDPMLSR